MNQLGKVNELIIKPDLSELTEGKEDKDVVEQTADKESGSKADAVFTATSLETALNQVIRKRTNYEGLFCRFLLTVYSIHAQIIHCFKNQLN